MPPNKLELWQTLTVDILMQKVFEYDTEEWFFMAEQMEAIGRGYSEAVVFDELAATPQTFVLTGP